MNMEERRVLGLVLAMILFATGQGCGSAPMEGELGPTDDPIADNPDNPTPGDDPDPTSDPDAALAPLSDLEPELLMLTDYNFEARVWGTAEDDIFLAGRGALLAHFDGIRWRPFELDAPQQVTQLTWIFGFASDDVYVGAGAEGVLHYDGERWSFVRGLGKERIWDLWGSGPNDVYAVGSSGLVHFDGFEWREVVTGLRTDVQWRGVAGSGQKLVVLIGRDSGSSSSSRFAYFNGTSWREAVISEEVKLQDVWSAGPRDAYAVGNQGVILHFDGESLNAMDSGTDRRLNSVHGTAGGEVFAVGGDVCLRFNGSVWTTLPTTPPADDSLPFAISVHAFASDRVFVVDRGIHRFDGESWETQLPYSDYISDIWANDAENVLFAGYRTHRYDGFSVEPEDLSSLGSPELQTAWGTGDRIFAAAEGGFFLYDGEHWGELANEPDIDAGNILDMFGTSEDDVFGVGWGGAIVRFDGAMWQAMDSGTEDSLRGVWASGPDDVYAVGDDETVLRYDGSAWTELFGSGFADYFGVTGFEAEHIVAPREDDAVYFSDGVSWRPEPGGEIEAVHGTAPDNLFGVGPRGLSHYDGERWTPISRIDLAGDERSIFAVTPREVYIAGDRGVFRYTP